MSAARTAASALLLLVAAGCFSNHQDSYPTEWSPIREDRFFMSGCPDLSGTYRFPGLITRQASGLEATLFGFSYATSRATHFSLSGPARGRIDVSIWRGNEKLRSSSLSYPEDFTCYENRLDLTKPPPHGRHEASRTYTRAQDGSLVEERRYTETAFIFLFIMIDAHRIWSRWEPFTSSPLAPAPPEE